jgi:hypothetical protein
MFRFHRPSAAMIVALVALVAAMSGNAVADGVTAVASALKKGSITSKHVKDRSLRIVDIRVADRKKLRGQQGPQGPQGPTGPQGPAGTPDGYTKTEADGKFLGKTEKAADSNELDGKDSSEFMGGRGAVGYAHRLMDEGQGTVDFIPVSGIGTLRATCDVVAANPSASISFKNTSGQTARVLGKIMRDVGGAESDDLAANPTLANDATTSFAQAVTGAEALGSWDWQVHRSGATLLSGSGLATFRVSAFLEDDKCRFIGQYIANSSASIAFEVGPVLAP